MAGPDVAASVAYLPGRWAALAAADVVLIADLDPAGSPFVSCWDALCGGAGVDAVLATLAATRVSFALTYRGEPGGRLVVAGTALAAVHDPGADRPVTVSSDGAAPWTEIGIADTAAVRLIAATEQLPEQAPALPLLAGIVLASRLVLTPVGAPAPEAAEREPSESAEPGGWVPPEPEASPAFVVEPLNPLSGSGRPGALSGAIPALPWRTPDSYGWELSGEHPSFADAGPTVASVPITPDPPAPVAPDAPPRPATPPQVAPPAPLVRAVRCTNGHLNPPYPGTCRVCGVALTVQEPFTVERPSLGTLVLSTGPAIDLDRDVLLGRAPFAVNEVGTRLVPLPSPNNDISRNHVRIALDGWSVQITDLASTNGTIVTLPGQPPVRLRAHDPFTIVAGTSVLIADEVGVRYEATP